MSENYFEVHEDPCPSCGGEVYYRLCDQCEDGFSHHDCGEDCCCCADPENNVPCDICRGKGYLLWCSACGKDLKFKQREVEA